MEERRRFRRLPTRHVTRLRTLPDQADDKADSALITDYSRGGVFIQTARRIPLDAAVEFDMYLEHNARVEFAGVVRWVSRAAQRGIGVEVTGGTAGDSVTSDQ